jgi:hypothetical protein
VSAVRSFKSAAEASRSKSAEPAKLAANRKFFKSDKKSDLSKVRLIIISCFRYLHFFIFSQIMRAYT